jgi:hypothetical protein
MDESDFKQQLQQQTVIKLSVKHHHKHNQSNKIKKQEGKQTHTRW